MRQWNEPRGRNVAVFGALTDKHHEEAKDDARQGTGSTLVAGGEGYEVNYFATKHGITREQARKIIGRIGNDRKKLNAAAEALKTRAAAARGGRR